VHLRVGVSLSQRKGTAADKRSSEAPIRAGPMVSE
jgi:hypothetical protein